MPSHGKGEEALMLFNQMIDYQDDGVIPNGITMVSVLTACSHCGMVCEAQEWFEKMESQFGIHRDVVHYTCMVDVFGRAGRLDDALKFIHEMEALSSSSQCLNFRPIL